MTSFDDRFVFKQLRGTAIETKMVPPYAIIFMDSLEEDILIISLLKPLSGGVTLMTSL